MLSPNYCPWSSAFRIQWKFLGQEIYMVLANREFGPNLSNSMRWMGILRGFHLDLSPLNIVQKFFQCSQHHSISKFKTPKEQAAESKTSNNALTHECRSINGGTACSHPSMHFHTLENIFSNCSWHLSTSKHNKSW